MPRLKPPAIPNCQNCGHPFQAQEKFCPYCGQKRQHLQSVWEMLEEFFSNLLSYDSKFYRSLLPFLFRPGFLTTEFIAGRRQRYVHPMRLYLVVSLLFFLTIGGNLDEIAHSRNAQAMSFSLLGSRDFYNISACQDSIVLYLSQGDSDSSARIKKQLYKIAAYQDSIAQEVQRLQERPEPYNFSSAVFMAKAKNISNPDSLMQATGLSDNFFNKLMAKQSLRLAQTNASELMVYAFSKISTITILMVPVLAFILKLLYWRRKRRYTEHLIFGLHLHAFIFLLIMLSLVVINWLSLSKALQEQIGLGAVLVFLVYVYAALWRVYRQGWFKTFVKFWMIGAMYNTAFFMVFALGLLMSVLFF